jgi:hypothetical protein
VVTADLGAAVFGLLAVYALRRYVQGTGRRRAAWVGLTVGFGQLAKFSLVVLYPVVLVGLVTAWRQGRTGRSKPGGRAPSLSAVCGDGGLIGLLSLLVINAGYGLSGTGRRLGQFEFRSHLLTRDRPRGAGLAPGGSDRGRRTT